MSHPYQEFENTTLWHLIDNALQALETNRDIKIETNRSYVIGYLVSNIIRVCPNHLSGDELVGVINALNEICHAGVPIHDYEFQTRLGIERKELQKVLRKLSGDA
jgi:hypothetical protein